MLVARECHAGSTATVRLYIHVIHVSKSSSNELSPTPYFLQGAITTFTKGAAVELIKKGIRMNAIAPGPVWTPLIPSSFPEDMVCQIPQQYVGALSVHS